MNKKIYFITTSILFVVVAAVHLLRVIYGWPLVLGDVMIPMWLSVVVVFVLAFLAVQGYYLHQRVQ